MGDDASTDDTPAVLERLAGQIDTLHVFTQPTNLGMASNASALMRQPRTDYIVRLDSDDELEQSFVSRLVPLMEAYPKAGYGHTAVTLIDKAGVPRSVSRLVRSSGFQDSDRALRASLSGFRAAANILMFRRGALEDLAFYEGRPNYISDYDLAVRMADRGYGNLYVDEVLARYRIWTDDQGLREKRKADQLEGYCRLFDEVLIPAWKKRKWNERELVYRRSKLAVHHCPSCFEPQYTPEEKAHLITLLIQLSNSPAVKADIMMCKIGLAPQLQYASNLFGECKKMLKAILKRMRHLAQPLLEMWNRGAGSVMRSHVR